MIQEKVNQLKKQFLNNCALIDSMVEKSVKGYLGGNEELLIEVIEKDEPLANEFEIELDGAITSVIAQYQPKAKTLRIILMVLKIANDLERIGDLAVKIAESGLELLRFGTEKYHIDLGTMHKEVKAMFSDAIDAFINEDSKLARNICAHDSVVDDIRARNLEEIMECIIKNPSTISSYLHLERISKSLERIADLSTNFAEDVVYIVEGEIIKHNYS